jgi:outer membrane protein assembly factor BamB
MKKMLVCALAIVLPTITMASTATWNCQGGSFTRSGFAPVGIDAKAVVAKWTVKTGGWVSSSPAIADGNVIFGSHDKKVFCVNQETGKQNWSFTTGNKVQASCFIDDQKVIAASLDKRIYCLDLKTGSKLWSFLAKGAIYSSPVVVAGKVYLASEDKNLYCLDATNGSKIFSIALPKPIYASIASDGENIFVGCEDNNLYCFTFEGKQLWKTEVGGFEWGKLRCSSPVVNDGRVYVGTDFSEIYCLNAKTGEKIWMQVVGDKAFQPAVTQDKVYVGSADYKCYCLDKKTGEIIWQSKALNWVCDQTLAMGTFVLVPS